MNKKICMCAAAALAMASCSNDELVEVAKNDAINFRTVVGLNTKATEVKTADLGTKGVYVTTFDAAGNLLFGETHYTKQADDTFSAGQYWGNNASLDFYLTLPALNDWVTGASLTKDSKKLTGVTVKDKIADQVDLVAKKATGTKATNTTTTVELEHVLSQIEIKAKNTNANYKYKVKGVRINNVSNKSDIDLSSNTWENVSTATGDIKAYSVVYDAAQVIELNSTTGDAATLTVKSNDKMTTDNAMLIPQTAAQAWDGTSTGASVQGSYISVLVNITTKDNVAVYPKGSTAVAETYGWVAVPVKFAWTKGNKYIYTLDFSKGAGKVDPVDPGTDVTPGQPGKDPDKGQPVLGDEIKFSVTVGAWTESPAGFDGNTQM